MAQRAQSGSRLQRPLWRAAFWSLTELPALLESALPPRPAPHAPSMAAQSASLPARLNTFPHFGAALQPTAGLTAAPELSMCPLVDSGRPTVSLTACGGRQQL